jgi:hypothetical protein
MGVSLPTSKPGSFSQHCRLKQKTFSNNNKITELMNQYTWWFEQTYPQKSGDDV